MSKSYKPKDDKELDEGFMKLAMLAGRIATGPLFRPPAISKYALTPPGDEKDLERAKYYAALDKHEADCGKWLEEEYKQFPEMYKTGDE
jgi:hypothetical protein